MAPIVRESLSNAGSASTNIVTGIGTAVGDTLLAVQVLAPGAAPSTHIAAPTAGTWTTIGTTVLSGRGVTIKTWYRAVTAAGANTVTFGGSYGGSGGQTVAVLVLADVHDTSPIEVGPSLHDTAGGSAASLALGPLTTTRTDCLIVAVYGTLSGNGYTPPAGMTEVVDRNNGAGFAGAGVAHVLQPAPGATGTKTPTGPSTQWAGQLVAFRSAAVPINAADSGTGAEAVTLAPSVGVADSGTGSDAPNLTVSLGATDSGTGSEQTSFWGYTGQYDPGFGSDVATAQALQQGSATDTGTGSEQALITSILDPTTDTGTGSETVGLLRQSTIADTGTGSEKSLGIGPTLTDSGLGIEDVRVREIAATRVLPIVPERRYEVVVAARIQQASGAPTFLEVEAVTWLSLAYTDTLSAPQDLTLTCQLATLPENVLTHLRRPDLFPFELWVRRDGQIIFAGPLQGWQVQDQKVTIKASGLLAYLSMMGLDFDRQFLAADQAVVVKTLVDAWQISQYGHFGIDTTRMTPTGRLVDQTYLRDELPNLLRAVQELGVADGGFDIEVDPQSRQLTTWSPQRGTDRSEGEDAIVLDTRNVTSSNLLCSIAPADLASDVFATGSKSGGDAPLFTAVTNAELRAKYGRTVTTRSYSNVADQATLDAYAASVRDARGRAFIVPGTKVRVTPDADIADYREGDTVSYDLGGELGTSGAFRIRSRTVTVDESGRESVDLEPV